MFLDCRWIVCANQSGVLGYAAEGEAGGRFVVADRLPVAAAQGLAFDTWVGQTDHPDHIRTTSCSATRSGRPFSITNGRNATGSPRWGHGCIGRLGVVEERLELGPPIRAASRKHGDGLGRQSVVEPSVECRDVRACRDPRARVLREHEPSPREEAKQGILLTFGKAFPARHGERATRVLLGDLRLLVGETGDARAGARSSRTRAHAHGSG